MNIFQYNKRTAAALLVSLTLLSACGNKKQEKQSQQDEEKQQSQMEVPPVEAVTIKKGMLQSSLQVPGELQPYQEVSLYAKISSYVKQYLADIGSEVHKNQLLMVLEAPEINAQLAQAKSHILQQKALYLASKANYDRLYNTSKTPGTVAQNDVDQAAARKNSDYANYEAAIASYREVANNLSYLQIRAPFDGVVSQRNVNAGAYVGPAGKGSDLPLLVIQEQKKLRLVISVPELNTGGLTNRNEVSFTVRSLPNEKFVARVKRLAGALDDRLRSERVEMDVYNPNKRLLPGMYAEVNLPMQSKDSTYVVPKTAVVTSTEKVFVVQITGNHRARWITVQKGVEAKDQMEIFSKELKPGDRIVKAATDEIRDGQPLNDNAKPKGNEQAGNSAGGADSSSKGKGPSKGTAKGGGKQGGGGDNGEQHLGRERIGEDAGAPPSGSKSSKGNKNTDFGNGGRVRD